MPGVKVPKCLQYVEIPVRCPIYEFHLASCGFSVTC